MEAPLAAPSDCAVRLCWIPLGAGGSPLVRWSGRLYEAMTARAEHRPAVALYHAALEVGLGTHVHVVEMTPAWGRSAPDRGVVAEGPVGLAPLGRCRMFRYEVRRWRDGTIPDRAHATGAPHLVDTDPDRAAALLQLVPCFPRLPWGADPFGVGDMWSSNSLVSWLLACSGHDTTGLVPPGSGRAPGWTSGLHAARRSLLLGRAEQVQAPGPTYEL